MFMFNIAITYNWKNQMNSSLAPRTEFTPVINIYTKYWSTDLYTNLISSGSISLIFRLSYSSDQVPSVSSMPVQILSHFGFVISSVIV